MLCKSYNNRYVIVLICFSFSLWIQENRAAAKAVTYSGSVGQQEVRTKLSQEDQQKLLERLLKTKGLPKGVKASEVIGIIGKSEKAEVVKEISPLEQELSEIKRRLHSSLYVSNNELKKIGLELYGSVQKKLEELPLQEEETVTLRNSAIKLAEQLGMFEKFIRLENALNTGVRERQITNDMISSLEIELKNIKDRVQDTFEQSSSFNQRIVQLEQQIKDQKALLVISDEEKNQKAIVKMERYLTFLENALKKDVIRSDVVKYIRISLDEMADPKKINFPAPQQRIITKRIENLKHLLGIFDYLLHMQTVVTQKDLFPIMTEGVAEGLRNVQKELEKLGLAKDLSDSVNKHIARVNNQLVPKLSAYLDQLTRDAEVISTLAQLTEMENQFKLLQKLRKNLDLTENQERDIDEKFVEIESLLNQKREPLLEQQKRNEELERIAQEQKRAREVELQKQRELQEQQEREERERQAVQERENARKREEQEKEQARIEKLNARKDAIEKVEKKIKTLIPEFVQLVDDWRNDQDQETRLRNSFYKRIEKPTAEEQILLKNLEKILDQKKNFMTSYSDRVKAIHDDIARLYEESGYDKEDLIPLLNKWVRILWDLREQLVKESQTLLMQTNQKKREQKSFLKGFIDRNELVMQGVGNLILFVDRIRIADDNKLVLIERAIQERDRPKKAPKPKRKGGAFNRYF